MAIQRQLSETLKQACFKGKVLILLGARQVGKTTLLRQLITDLNVPSIWLNADEGDIKQELNLANTSTRLLQMIGDKKLVIIDEAQQITDIGLKLKLLFDTRPDIQVIATGSSAFELQNEGNEPLTGRKKEFKMFPLTTTELTAHFGMLEEKRLLETRLIYGSYPEVINNAGKEKEVLTELANSYLYKDLLRFDGIKKSSMLEKLLQALALQTGNEVHYYEVAQTIGNIDPATVEKYIDLLEKAFVVYRLPALSRNFRNELKKGKKVYFFDNGIRNVLLSNFTPFESRLDKGALWENYLMAERMKRNAYSGHTPNRYFWRTRDQAEIDYVEEYDGILHAYEFKWKTHKKIRFPQSFMDAYPQHTTALIDSSDYLDFIS